MTVTIATLGFPRIGPKRELKTALENYWAGKTDATGLLAVAAELRAQAWARQRALGADIIPSNDFSLYDHVLDTSAMVGAIPAIYGWDGGPVGLETYFAMARGAQGRGACEHAHAHHQDGVAAAEMTKWFDTNYHYLVPDFAEGQRFALSSTKAVDEFLEAKTQGIVTRPVLLGPVTFLKLGKTRHEGFDPRDLLGALLPVYAEMLRRLAEVGAEWVQIDEPCLVLDLDARDHAALREAYAVLAHAVPRLGLMLTTYFGGLGDNLATALSLPVHGLHVDLVRAPEQLDAVLAGARPDLVLSLGVIDGRNIWKADLAAILDRVEPVVAAGHQVILAPSCSLLHTPIDLERENALDPEIRNWLAFAVQKIAELATLARALNEGRDAVKATLDAASAAAAARLISPRIHDPAVQARLRAVDAAMARRASPFAARRAMQHAKLDLPA
jgi:5-methyltetrahydropteroyltriglutamate--homocysteine methyltransferase